MGKEILLPNYSINEERFNCISHILGSIFGLVALILCVVKSAELGDALWICVSIFYGISIIALYVMSSIYHGLTAQTAKKVFRVLDHCTIYLLILGSYMPLVVATSRVNPTLAIVMALVEIVMFIIAVTLTAIDVHKFRVFSMICYIVMGWLVILAVRPIIEVLSIDGFLFVLAGGLSYTVGAVTYGIGGKRKYFHNIFHVLCLVGTILQFIGIYIYAIK